MAANLETLACYDKLRRSTFRAMTSPCGEYLFPTNNTPSPRNVFACLPLQPHFSNTSHNCLHHFSDDSFGLRHPMMRRFFRLPQGEWFFDAISILSPENEDRHNCQMSQAKNNNDIKKYKEMHKLKPLPSSMLKYKTPISHSPTNHDSPT